MGGMSRLLTALLGAVGAAAIGIYIESRRARRAVSDGLEPGSPAAMRGAESIDIDDDTAADIIMRARPALERARALLRY